MVHMLYLSDIALCDVSDLAVFVYVWFDTKLISLQTATIETAVLYVLL